ncbi:MAG: hypothetical protein R3F46_03990 [bacterium]
MVSFFYVSPAAKLVQRDSRNFVWDWRSDMQDGLFARIEVDDGLRLEIHSPADTEVASVPFADFAGKGGPLAQQAWVHVVGKHILISNPEKGVWCLDEAGKKLWELPDMALSRAFGAAPAICNGRMILAGEQKLLAVDDDGSIAWEYRGSPGSHLYCTQADAERMFLASGTAIEMLSASGELLESIELDADNITACVMDSSQRPVFSEMHESDSTSFTLRRLEPDGSITELLHIPQPGTKPVKPAGIYWLRAANGNDVLAFTTAGVFRVDQAGNVTQLTDVDAIHAEYLPNAGLLATDNTLNGDQTFFNAAFGCRRIQLIDMDGKVQRSFYKKFWFTQGFADDQEGHVYQLSRRGGLRQLVY